MTHLGLYGTFLQKRIIWHHFMSNKGNPKIQYGHFHKKKRFTFLGANVHYLNTLAKTVKECHLG